MDTKEMRQLEYDIWLIEYEASIGKRDATEAACQLLALRKTLIVEQGKEIERLRRLVDKE